MKARIQDFNPQKRHNVIYQTTTLFQTTAKIEHQPTVHQHTPLITPLKTLQSTIQPRMPSRVDEISTSHAHCHRIALMSIPDHGLSKTIIALIRDTITSTPENQANFQAQPTIIVATTSVSTRSCNKNMHFDFISGWQGRSLAQNLTS